MTLCFLLLWNHRESLWWIFKMHLTLSLRLGFNGVLTFFGTLCKLLQIQKILLNNVPFLKMLRSQENISATYCIFAAMIGSTHTWAVEQADDASLHFWKMLRHMEKCFARRVPAMPMNKQSNCNPQDEPTIANFFFRIKEPQKRLPVSLKWNQGCYIIQVRSKPLKFLLRFSKPKAATKTWQQETREGDTPSISACVTTATVKY